MSTSRTKNRNSIEGQQGTLKDENFEVDVPQLPLTNSLQGTQMDRRNASKTVPQSKDGGRSEAKNHHHGRQQMNLKTSQRATQ